MGALDGKVVAITGAASGIGRALALEVARRGGSVALCDIDEQGLGDTSRAVDDLGARATTQIVDVADRDAVETWASKVVADHGKVDMVVNNAGVALVATVERMSYEDFEWLMGINFWGMIYGTKAFLPHLRAGGGGHVVNVSSIFGLVGVPSQSAYNAAKFAVRGFTEALRIELDSDRSGRVSCTTVHPGGIRTGIVRHGRFDSDTMRGMGQDPDKAPTRMERVFITSPEKAARIILDAAARNRRRVLIGPDAQLFKVLSYLPPGVFQNVIGLGTRLGTRLLR